MRQGTGDLIRAGLDAAKITTVDATVRRVVREELVAWFGPKVSE